MAQLGQKSSCKMQEIQVQSLGGDDPLEKRMAPTPVFLPGESPWTEDPGRLQSTGSQRVRHDGATISQIKK